MIETDAGTPLICRDSAYLQTTHLTPSDHLPRTTPAVAATTTNRIKAIPSTPSRENTTPALRIGKPSFRETFPGKYGGLFSPDRNPQVGADTAR